MNRFALNMIEPATPAYQPDPAAVSAGAAPYTPLTLLIYDMLVHGLSNRLVWRCPAGRLRQLYDRNLSANHLDVGVGTGYFLDRARIPGQRPRLVLMDLNPHCLNRAARRLNRHNPNTVRHDAFQPAPTNLEPFDSLGLTYLFHCLPGVIEQKSVVLDNLKPLLNPGARVFGATILSPDEETGWAARRLMALYNRKRVFSNLDDRLEALEAALEDRFDDVDLGLIGCVALFEATAPGAGKAVANDH